MKKTLLAVIMLTALLFTFSCSKKLPDTSEFECEFDKKNKTVSIIGYNGNNDEVVIPEKFGNFTVTSIGRNAFSKKYDISKITIPDTVKTVGDRAFELCIGIKEITLPNNLETIGNAAFSNCRNIRRIIIPESVSKIGLSVFTGCTSLEKIEVALGNKNYTSDKYGALFDKNQTILIQYPLGSQRTKYEMPDTVTVIESYAFEKAKNVEDITFSKNLKTIKSYAFQSCGIRNAILFDKLEGIGNFSFNESKLTSITFGKNVKTIGDSAFSWCTSLSEVSIPSATDNIGTSSFFMCTSVERYNVEEGNENYTTDSCGALFNKDMTVLMYYPVSNTGEEYVIPNTVQQISANAFSTSLNLKKVTIPDSVEMIGELAFSQCPNLSDVIYEGTKPQNIAENAFEK
ncbi:MAG: leucine-rich repeat domain-containing protein [Ruminococcaceae bacterium]|nr:leucine-rich repeat domain-containing protein [Oscillospiraceae bacterium]